jgi:segregation and condensation protein A
MADSLAQRADAGLRAFPRLAPVPMVESGPGLQDVNLVTLRDLMHDVLARIDERPAPPQGVVARQLVSLAQRVEGLRARLRRDGRVSFRRVLMASATREDVVIAFLAVLELIRMGECEAVQDTAWGEIELTRPGMRAAG